MTLSLPRIPRIPALLLLTAALALAVEACDPVSSCACSPLPPVLVSGQVQDPAGRGVRGAQLSLVEDGTERSVPGSTAASRNDGSFELHGTRDGAYTVFVLPPSGYALAQDQPGAVPVVIRDFARVQLTIRLRAAP